MHPIRINLLSNEKKKYLNRMIYVQFIKNTFISIVFVFCISGIILLGCQSVLQEYFSEVSSSLTVSGGVNSTKNKQIQSINDTINRVEALQEIHNSLSFTIIEFGNVVPEGVILNNLFINNGSKKIDVSGVAKDRKALLSFRDAVNSLKFTENIEIPISQLTEKENINFSIQIDMK